MTTAEKIESLEEQLRAAKEAVVSVSKNLHNAQNDLFRERHGFSIGDWILFHGAPARISRISVSKDSEYDGLHVRVLTKAGELSMREKGGYALWAKVSEYAAPWPAGRPLPEEKP